MYYLDPRTFGEVRFWFVTFQSSDRISIHALVRVMFVLVRVNKFTNISIRAPM